MCLQCKSFKKMWGNKKLLVISSFSFSHSVFYPIRELSAIFIEFKIVVCKLFHHFTFSVNSYDTRCYSCSKRGKVVIPTFDFRHQTCCDGKIQELLPNKTCCCGTKVFNPERFYCCEGVITERPADVPGDCCGRFSIKQRKVRLTL